MSNRLNYVTYEFSDLVTQLQNLLKSKDTWADVYRSSTGQTLIEFYAYVVNMLLYYVERTAEEVYISTAQKKSSVINLASLLNYIPSRNVSAIGNALFTFSTSKLVNVYIPAKTVLQTSTGYKYAVSQDYVLFPGQTSISVSVVQGEWQTDSYTSTGEINQEYTISSTKVENTNLKVYVNNVEWTYVTSFVNSVSSSTVFRIVQNLDDTITIQFGDNVFGMAPSASQSISIQYLESDGVNGNVYSSGSLTTISSSLYDADGNVVTDVSVTNTSSILGGDNAETIEDIRYNAPRVFSTGDRFVTKEDGIAIISDYPSVASVNVWGEAEESSPSIANYNQVKISCILQDWTLPSTDFKSDLSDYLYTKAPLTIRFSYEDPSIVEVYPSVTAYVKSGYSLTSVESSIETTLQAAFTLGDTSKIGTDVRHGPVLKSIQSLDGVSYSYVTLQGYKVLTHAYNSSHDYGGLLDLVKVKANTVYIYVDDVLVGSDNGSGTITDLSTSYTVSGSINYTTGEIFIEFTPNVTTLHVVSVRYQQDESGDLVVTKNQILKYKDSVITLAYE